jgi:hypothetical protein
MLSTGHRPPQDGRDDDRRGRLRGPGVVVGVHEHPLPHRRHGAQPVTVEVAERRRRRGPGRRSSRALPHDTVLRDGDLIEVTAGELTGSVWHVVEADAADQQTARRVPVIAAEHPEEWS